MSEKPSDVVRTWFERVWNEGDLSAIDEMFPEGSVAHGIGGGLHGPAAFRVFHKSIQDVCDDVHIDVLESIDCGDRTYVRCKATMRLGDRTVSFDGGSLLRIEEGKLVEARDVWDFQGALIQLGVITPETFLEACAAVRAGKPHA